MTGVSWSGTIVLFGCTLAEQQIRGFHSSEMATALAPSPVPFSKHDAFVTWRFNKHAPRFTLVRLSGFTDPSDVRDQQWASGCTVSPLSTSALYLNLPAIMHTIYCALLSLQSLRQCIP